MLAGTLTMWKVLGWQGTQWRRKAWSKTLASALSLISHHACRMGQFCHPFIVKLKLLMLPEIHLFCLINEYLFCPGTYTWSLVIPTYRPPWQSLSLTAFIPHHPGIKCDQMGNYLWIVLSCSFSLQNADTPTQSWSQQAWNLYGRQQVKLLYIYNSSGRSWW